MLGPERLTSLTIHHGRHTFTSHAVAGGRTLAEVRDAAGHANVSIPLPPLVEPGVIPEERRARCWVPSD